MYDFDATNTLSGDRHSGFEESFDKAKYWEDNKKVWKSTEKEKETRSNILNKETAQQKDRLEVPPADTSSNNGSETGNNKQNTKKTKHEKSRQKIHTEAGITPISERIITTQRKTTTTTFRNVSQNDASVTTALQNIRKTPTTIKNKINPKLMSKSTTTGKQTSLLEVPGFSGKPSSETIKPLHSDVLVKGSKHNASEISGSPYVPLLASSTAVLAVALIILVIFYIYKRRHRTTSVISDEMYNAYKLTKKIETRSPLPSPRGSDQGVRCNYDFITVDEVSPKRELGETTEFQEPDESVYIELDDSTRYDYATAPSSIVTMTTEQRL